MTRENIYVVERRPLGRAHSLVSLPLGIRRRIYLHTGVARFDGQPYTYFLDGRRKPKRTIHPIWAGFHAACARPEPDSFDPPSTRNFVGLLRCCRALYVEIAALLYSANRFAIFYSHQGSLEPLRLLAPTFLASLTSLKIVLNQACHKVSSYDPSQFPPYCWCGHADEYYDFWAVNHHCTAKRGGQHRRALLHLASESDSTASTAEQAAQEVMIGEWHDVVAPISSYVGDGRLELSLVCDIDPEHSDASNVARRAIAPLILFPRLRNCQVRLSKAPSHPLQQMAQEAALKACGRATPVRLNSANLKLSSPLTSLPPELRIRILEYTDLITPWKEVTWSRQVSSYQVIGALCESSRYPCPPDNHHGCRLYLCDPTLDFSKRNAPHSGCCFCRVRHSAFSFACNCWAPPTDLFLICRTLYRDAQFVFFSHNRFIVYDHYGRDFSCLPEIQLEPATLDTINTTDTAKYYPFDRLAASMFLRDVVPIHCLSHLRFLELVFPPYVPHGWPREDHPAIQDWIATIDWLRGQIHAPALTLRIVMADFAGPIVGRTSMTEAQIRGIWSGYRTIAEPLAPLAREDGLGRFFMQVAHPERWTPEFRQRVEYEISFEHERQGEGFAAVMEGRLSRLAERWVKGEGEGEGKGEGRGDKGRDEPSKSTWQRWYNVDSYSD
ncbi:hypothetical protein C7999DRAFT_35516 [Corynascus novoguineensis]|uniref:F-box domain-containing protein n=1 Tax=Corynascus novoguineensis TaxID=1126955 RepID=A0AAN7HJ93_9PEZI|nr:hypothetical protein C7999DRAFT_35516 [Corynascus novoguineensis]